MYVTNKPATAIIIALAAFLIATLALACSSATPRAGDVNTDRAALATLYNATNGSSWQDDTNWLSNGPLGEWHGVSTDADGRVAELDLDGKQLSGADTVGTGQPRQPGIPVAPRQPVERLCTRQSVGYDFQLCHQPRSALLLSLSSTDVRAPVTAYMAVAEATAVPAQRGLRNWACANQEGYQYAPPQ